MKTRKQVCDAFSDEKVILPKTVLLMKTRKQVCDAFSYEKVILPIKQFYWWKQENKCDAFLHEKVIPPKNSITYKNKTTRMMFFSKTFLRQIYFFEKKMLHISYLVFICKTVFITVFKQNTFSYKMHHSCFLVFISKTMFRQNYFFVRKCITLVFLFSSVKLF